MTTSHDVIAAARAYHGVRFAHQGRSREGLDCLGLLLVVARDLSLTFEKQPAAALDQTDYGARPDVTMLQHKLMRYLVPVPTSAVRAADILLLRVDGSPQHLALLTDYPLSGELGMIHAYAPARQVTEHRYDTHWQQATAAAFRLPTLT